jgi:ABC-type transport system involved in multi-copper enzyme maturation permease subunit
MYLWKYWRESRITFAVGMALVGLLLWAVLKIHVGDLGQGPNGTNETSPATIYLLMAAPLVLPLGFLALLFGSFGVGRDLGEGSGSFLFSRPRSRAFFVWSDWGCGMAQLLLIVLAANAVLALAVYRITGGGGPILLAGKPVPMASIFVLHCIAGLLLIGLLMGLTYFSSVLAKNRGVLLALGVVLAYYIAKAVVNYKWPSITLPDLTLTEFSMTPQGPPGFAKNLGLEIALRAAVALAFPFAAQILLQQRDVD